jgi:DNA mismatch repair protein MutL
MGIINLLSDELISQIAAGEVVERPASAVKELVENSVDAGAARVTVEVSEGGMKMIRVVDDGRGMSAEDAERAFMRHATSKISSLSDLFAIRTLGFRGEALASIASIATVTMRTRRAEDRVGVEVVMDRGARVDGGEVACASGTDITVSDLFKHTPARKKYMKSESTEYGHIFDCMMQIALSHPEVSFRLLRGGSGEQGGGEGGGRRSDEIVFDLPAGQDLKERVRSLFGNETAKALLPVKYGQMNLKISGFIGKPELSRSTKKYQFLFVNGRAIENRLISHAVGEAFHSLLMHEKYPWYALSIEIDPEFLDVNVHPRKVEVKFLNSQEVYRAVQGSVAHALSNFSLAPIMEGFTAPTQAPALCATANAGQARTNQTEPICSREQTQILHVQSYPAHELPTQKNLHEDGYFSIKGVRVRPIAQIANSYIIAESEEGLAIIDQHAAHERVRYARIVESQKNAMPMKQPLLVPLEIEVGASGMKILKEFGLEIEALGYELEPFGGNSFLLRTVPAGMEKKNPDRLLLEVLADFDSEIKAGLITSAGPQSASISSVKDALAKITACRGAIKFGDPLPTQEIHALLADMEQTPDSSHCPHGRPAIITLTFDKLEELFKRKKF